MKKLLVSILLSYGAFSLWGDDVPDQTKLVFMSRIDPAKKELVKQAASAKGTAERLFLEELGITNYRRWIQDIKENQFLIHFIEGDNLDTSLELLREKIYQGDPFAIQLYLLYQNVLGVDLGHDSIRSSVHELTELLEVNVEKEPETLIKDYCFIYPILPGKKEKLLKLFVNKEQFFSQEMQNICSSRGVSKCQYWLQESSQGSFLVIYQEIIGPVVNAREKYLDARDEEFNREMAEIFMDITGLSYEELLPKLESLFDGEILH